MTQVFTLPDLGEGLEDAQLVRWLVSVGDAVAVDAPVAEVETAKAMVEVPCPYAGVVAFLHGQEGDVIAVGSPLVSVDEAGRGDPSPDRAMGDVSEPTGSGPGPTEGPTPSGNVLVGYGTSDAPMVGAGRRGARRAAAAEAQPPAPLSAPVHAARVGVAVSSPLVRSLARTAGVDLARVTGTGPGGLVTRSDVERAADARPSQPGGAAPPFGTSTGTGPGIDPRAGAAHRTATGTDERTGLPITTRVPLQGVRGTIARTMARSRQEIPEATTWVDVDATALLDLRSALTAGDRRGPGVLALVARFVVAGLARYPELNARVDTEGGEVVHLGGVNLGIAAQTDRGLVVPVVRGAHRLATRALDDEIRRLTATARDGRSSASDLTGGSFTLNNYGSLGVDGSAAIINHPEVAILGMGRILARPWVVDGAVLVRSVMQLSLVFDHRVCDGGTAGGFLRYVADAVERPMAALVELAEL
ncbi:MAG: branched-chain alpha-keto acid dehydrogenase subunit [Actinotalea sp.]|nr:branched-chain alpha-keto acid dehydrogenase subunit [Actinotalea sp.]